MPQISNRIKEFRETKGLTQEDLAKSAQLSRPVISQFEQGQRTPSLKALQRIAKALNVEVNDLLGSSQKDSSSSAEYKVLLRGFDKLTTEDRKVVQDLINHLSSKGR